MSEDKPIKAILLGEDGVGKTNLFRMVLESEFNPEYFPSYSAEKCDRAICIDNKDYLFYLWDTPGQEKFRSLNGIFINRSHVILIVFEINKRESFNQIDFWYNLVKEILGNDGYIIALVGNKSDLYLQQEISDEEIEKKAKELKTKFIIMSAKNNYGDFKMFFDDLLKDYINKYHPEESKKCLTPTTKRIKLEKERKKKKKEFFRKICTGQ